MKNIIISGGAGFIGTNVATEAIRRGYKVTVFDNLWRPEVADNVKLMQKKYKDKYKFVWGDVRNEEDFNMLSEMYCGIIHLAANPGAITSVHHPLYDFNSNAIGTLNALHYARIFCLPFIYASTTKTMSDITDTMEMKETDTRYEWTGLGDEIKDGVTLDENGVPLAINDRFPIDGYGKYGHSPYGISKLTGELLTQEYHVTFQVPAVIFRMSCIYGLFQKGAEEQGWVDWFLRQVAHGDGKITIFGNGKQVRDVLDGRDMARAYLDALENIDKVNGEVFTIGGGEKVNTSLLELVKKLEELTGKKATLKFEKKRPADQDLYISCNRKVKRLLNWEPKFTLEQTLKDMLKQYGS